MRARLHSVVLLLAATLVGAAGAPAGAEEFARVERVEIEPSFEGLARVRAWTTLIHHDGRLIDNVKPDELRLHVGASNRTDVPWIVPFEATGAPLELVLVVEIGLPYAMSLETIVEGGAKFLKELPKGTRVAVMPYGASVGKARLGDLAAAQRAWKRLRAEEEEGAPLQLAEAVDKAIKLLTAKKDDEPRTPMRRLIVIVSDGVVGSVETEVVEAERAEMRRRIQKLAKTASDADITIHTIGFSPYDFRKPLVNLGELSRKTTGTFRWALDADMISGQLTSLTDEIRQQRVATWYVPAEAVAGKTVSVTCKSAACGPEEVESNARKLPEWGCGADACEADGRNVCVEQACVTMAAASGGGPGWWLYALGAVVVVGGAVVVVKRGGGESPRGLKPIGPFVPMPGVPQHPMPGMPQHGQPGMPQQSQAQPRPGMSAQWPQPQAQAPRPPAAPAPQAAAGVGWFYVMNGPRQGQQIPLRHGFAIGKAPGNDLLIDDGFTSGRHAQVVVDAAGVHIVDVGSTNGLFVNGVRTTHGNLVHGTSVRVGQTELRFLKG